jgi:uncharacterized protein (TIGR00369 family)
MTQWGPTALLVSGGTAFTVTINMNMSYFQPAKPGRLFAEGRVLNMGKTIAFLEATISDAHGIKLASATASARVVPVDKLPQPKQV